MHFTSSDSAASLPADSALTSGAGAFSATFTLGNQTITVTDTVNSAISNVSSVIHVYLRGDANGDGQVTVADVFYLVNFIFVNGQAPIGAGDTNADGQIAVADIFYLVNYLFAGGPQP